MKLHRRLRYRLELLLIWLILLKWKKIKWLSKRLCAMGDPSVRGSCIECKLLAESKIESLQTEREGIKSLLERKQEPSRDLSPVRIVTERNR